MILFVICCTLSLNKECPTTLHGQTGLPQFCCLIIHIGCNLNQYQRTSHQGIKNTLILPDMILFVICCSLLLYKECRTTLYCQTGLPPFCCLIIHILSRKLFCMCQFRYDWHCSSIRGNILVDHPPDLSKLEYIIDYMRQNDVGAWLVQEMWKEGY
jgi:hypothetical protein